MAGAHGRRQERPVMFGLRIIQLCTTASYSVNGRDVHINLDNLVTYINSVRIRPDLLVKVGILGSI